MENFLKTFFLILCCAGVVRAQEVGKRYLDIGANPVSRTQFWDPKSECILRTDSEVEVETSDRAGKKRKGWLHKGEYLVVDKATKKALRIQFCSNPVHTDIVPSGTYNPGCIPDPPQAQAAPAAPAEPSRMTSRQEVEIFVGADEKTDAPAVTRSDKGASSGTSGGSVMENEQKVSIRISKDLFAKPAAPPVAAPAPPPSPSGDIVKGKPKKGGKAWKVLAAVGAGGAVAAVILTRKGSSSPSTVHFPPPPVLPPTSY